MLKRMIYWMGQGVLAKTTCAIPGPRRMEYAMPGARCASKDDMSKTEWGMHDKLPTNSVTLNSLNM